jgi:hypothetical protein
MCHNPDSCVVTKVEGLAALSEGFFLRGRRNTAESVRLVCVITSQLIAFAT